MKGNVLTYKHHGLLSMALSQSTEFAPTLHGLHTDSTWYPRGTSIDSAWSYGGLRDFMPIPCRLRGHSTRTPCWDFYPRTSQRGRSLHRLNMDSILTPHAICSDSARTLCGVRANYVDSQHRVHVGSTNLCRLRRFCTESTRTLRTFHANFAQTPCEIRTEFYPWSSWDWSAHGVRGFHEFRTESGRIKIATYLFCGVREPRTESTELRKSLRGVRRVCAEFM